MFEKVAGHRQLTVGRQVKVTGGTGQRELRRSVLRIPQLENAGQFSGQHVKVVVQRKHIGHRTLVLLVDKIQPAWK